MKWELLGSEAHWPRLNQIRTHEGAQTLKAHLIILVFPRPPHQCSTIKGNDSQVCKAKTKIHTAGVLLGVNWSESEKTVDDEVAGRTIMAKDPHREFCFLEPKQFLCLSLGTQLKGRDSHWWYRRDLKSFIPPEGRLLGAIIDGAVAMQNSYVATASQAWAAVSLIQCWAALQRDPFFDSFVIVSWITVWRYGSFTVPRTFNNIEFSHLRQMTECIISHLSHTIRDSV